MGINFLLDTNAIIDYLDNKLTESASILIAESKTNISVINRMELLSWPGAGKQQTTILLKFIKLSNEYSLTEPIINRAIDLRKSYKTKLPDAIIAATALVNNLTLVTRNVKDFDKIEGLAVINPHNVKNT